MTVNSTCPLSQEPALVRETTEDYTEYDCPTCGIFRIGSAALALGDDQPGILREALRVANTAALPGDIPLISNVAGG